MSLDDLRKLTDRLPARCPHCGGILFFHISFDKVSDGFDICLECPNCDSSYDCGVEKDVQQVDFAYLFFKMLCDS